MPSNLNEQHVSFPPSTDEAWQSYIEDFRRSGHETVDWIARYLSNIRQYPVLATTKPGELVDSLPPQGPEVGEQFETILSDFDRVVMPAVVHWNHPSFFAYFACTGSTPAILGEMLAAALNTNGLHWKTSPAVAELEQVTLAWLRQWMNLPDDFFGIIYDTASVSSFHAICAAREKFDPSAREDGQQPGLVMYTSDQSHSSIEKGAIAAGIGHKNVRRIASDDRFRMRIDALSDAIERDKAAGLKPFLAVATLGTTSSTSVDPISEIADVCQKHGMWLHADTAYAGVCAILPEYRETFAGLERADSIVVNPHKWLMTNIDLSVFFTRHPDILARAFSLTPEYLRTTEDPRAHNLMDYGVPLGHRFRALKFWFVLRYFGLEGLRSSLREHIAMAKEFESWVRADTRFELSAPTLFSVVCFRLKASDDENRALIDRINASGKVFLSHTNLHGKIVLRIAIGNLGTRPSDVREAWEVIQKATAERTPAR
jgi:aromatic-L-amino-acid/L-tryptophan decarboxylase